MGIWYVGYPTHWTRFFYLDFQMEYNRGRHRVWVRANRGLSYMKIGPGSGSTFTARCGWASKGPSPSGLKIDGPPDADLQKTVVRTNKGRTNKGQITFFRKIYWGLIRDKYYICKKKFSTKQKIADFLFRPVFFGKKLSLLTAWKPEVNRWRNISLISLWCEIKKIIRFYVIGSPYEVYLTVTL